MELLHADHNNLLVQHTSLDNPGHDYLVESKDDAFIFAEIFFQEGPVKERGVNGVTSEALLAILIHRTNHLNNLFPCDENATALAGMKQALEAFESRTMNRISRGVEGQNKL